MQYNQEQQLASLGIQNIDSLVNKSPNSENLDVISTLKSLDNNLSPEETNVIITEIKFLASCWIDEYEKSIFEDLT
jgi:hypothetical protein